MKFVIENLSYGYIDGGKKRMILKDLSYEFEPGNFYTILGPSGSGKSTFLALAGALDVPEKGTIKYGGKNINKIGLTNFRRDSISLIFQKYNLIDFLTGVENVQSDMMISKKHKKVDKQLAYKILQSVGIVKSKADRMVTTLSGGEQQRVAIARTLVRDTEVILGDEPTGALDSATSKEIVKLFKQLAKDYNKTIILVTHSDEVANMSDIKLHLKDGKLVA